MHIKAKWVLAKCHSKIKDLVKAEDLCDFISEQIRSKSIAEKYWKFELKAMYLKSKQIAACMEFKRAKRILDKDVKPLLDKLVESFTPKIQTELVKEEVHD